jgi:hypothetical protein
MRGSADDWHLRLETLAYPSEFAFRAEGSANIGGARLLVGSCHPPVPLPAKIAPSGVDELHTRCALVDSMLPDASIAGHEKFYVNVYLGPDDRLTSAASLPPPDYVGFLSRE